MKITAEESQLYLSTVIRRCEMQLNTTTTFLDWV